MQISVAEKIVATSHEFPSTICTVDAEDMRYIASLLRNNYSNTILATIRETYANAVDANLENRTNICDVIIKVPTRFDPTYSVRDQGKGLTREEIFNLYSKFGKSTKRGSNVAIGGFGIGRFAPLSYQQSFTVESFCDGNVTVYTVYISEENDTKIDEVFSQPCGQPSGIRISVGVNAADINKFVDTVQTFFKYNNNLPKFIGENIIIAKPEAIISNDEWMICSRDWSNRSYIVMGSIAYPIDTNLIQLPKEFENHFHISGQIIFFANVGDVSLHHSRESLEYTNSTKKYLVDRHIKMYREIDDLIVQKINSFDCLREALKYTNILRGSIGSGIMDNLAVNGKMKFKDVDLHYQRSQFIAGYTDDKGLTHKIPATFVSYEYGASETRLNTRRYCNTYYHDHIAYLLNDEGISKVAPYVYSLLNKGFKNVIVVSHDDSMRNRNEIDGVETFATVNNIHLIKTNIYRIKDVVPDKIKGVRTRTNNNSYRKSYSLFHQIENRAFVDVKNVSDLDDVNIKKVYIPIVDKKPIGVYARYHSNGSNNNCYKLNTDLLYKFVKEMGHDLYAVTNNIVQSNKFSQRKDFVDLTGFINQTWKNFTESEKLIAYNAAKYNHAMISEIGYFKAILDKVSIFTDFMKNKEEAMKHHSCTAYKFGLYINLLPNICEITYNGESLYNLSEIYSNKTFDQIYAKYPVIKFLSSNRYSLDINNVNHFIDYVKMIDEKNNKPLDIPSV